MNKQEQIAKEKAYFAKDVQRLTAHELHRLRMSSDYNAKNMSKVGRPGLAAQGAYRVEVIDREVERRASEGWLHLTPLQKHYSTKPVSGNGGFKTVAEVVAEDDCSECGMDNCVCDWE